MENSRSHGKFEGISSTKTNYYYFLNANLKVKDTSGNFLSNYILFWLKFLSNFFGKGYFDAKNSKYIILFI